MIINIKSIIISLVLFSAVIGDVFAQGQTPATIAPIDPTLAPSSPTPTLDTTTAQSSSVATPTPALTQTPTPATTTQTSATPTQATVQEPTNNPQTPTQNPTSAAEVSTAQAIDQIQKTLLFSDQDAAKRKSVERKSSLNIDRGVKSAKSSVEISIEDNDLPKAQQKIIEKQNLAYKATTAGQYEVAIELYKQILKSDPNNHYASFALAACYHKLGQYRQAKAIYYDLLKHEWSDKKTEDELVNNLIEVTVEESPNEAIYLLKKLSAQSPNSPSIIAGTAMAYDKMGKSDQAVLLLRKAINLNPREVRYKFNLAIIYDKMANHEQALRYYQEVMNSYLLGNDLDNSLPIEQIKQRIDFIKQEYSV